MATKKGGSRRYSKFRTQWRHIAVIDREIRRGSYPSAPKLARTLELSSRTVKRHIEFMRWDLGAPIQYDASRKGYCYGEDDWVLPAIRISEGELFAIVLAERALRGVEDPGLADKVRRVFTKIAVQLPEEVDLKPSALADVGFAEPRSPEIDAGVFTQLTGAVGDRRTVRIVYWKLSSGKTVERTVDPYTVRCIGGEWYLAGYTHETGYVSLFHLGRVREIEVTRDRFDRDAADFDADEYFRHSLGASHSEEARLVRVRFTGWAARYVAERQWHESQKLRERNDGSVVLQMKVGWLDEVAAWVLPFCELAEVLEPAELRTSMKDRLKRALALYA